MPRSTSAHCAAGKTTGRTTPNGARQAQRFLATYRDFERERAQTDVKRRITAAYDRAVNGDATFAEADAEARSLIDDLI